MSEVANVDMLDVLPYKRRRTTVACGLSGLREAGAGPLLAVVAVGA